MKPESCEDCAFLRHQHVKGRKLFKCINHVAPSLEELRRDCIWDVGVKRSIRDD